MKYYTEGTHDFERPRDDDAGYDLRAAERVEIRPGETKRVKTGLRLAIPRKNQVGFIKERGSMGSKGIAVRAGVVDYGYRGEIEVVLQYIPKWGLIEHLLWCAYEWSGMHVNKVYPKFQDVLRNNDFFKPYIVEPGDKIAQLIIVNITKPHLTQVVSVEDLGKTERGEDAWGSTNN